MMSSCIGCQLALPAWEPHVDSTSNDSSYCSWLKIVQRDCQVRGLSRNDAMVRGRWRKLIRMVDEQECEWMNVSSGTGSPE